MRTFVLPLAILGALAACNDSPSETAQAPPRDAAETAAPAPPETASPSPAASTIPAVIQGRWGLTDADCEPGRDDAKGLLTITANELDFYESVGTLDDIKELGETRIRADFDFVGEGQEWERDVTLEAREGGTVLIRREDGVDAAPGEFRYTKCA